MTRTTPLKRSPMKPGRVAKARKPLARVGARGKRNRPMDDEWREAVKDRDYDICVRCGSADKPVEAHHILGKQSRPDLRHVLANGATLCVDAPGIGGCHYNWAHGSKTTGEARRYLLRRLTDSERNDLEAAQRGGR